MPNLSRRHLIASTAGLAAAAALPMPGWAKGRSLTRAAQGFGTLTGEDIALTIGEHHFMTGARAGHAIAVNGSVPGPLIRLREGQDVRLHVTNHLAEDSSIHWHGLLLPFQFDGVPGVSFPGIAPGETFTYSFFVRQSGTYWWHSHSGLQEQAGHYGPLVIESAEPDPRYDRDYVVLLSEFTALHPHDIMRKLKVGEHYFQRQMQTASEGDMPGEMRRMWGRMRMNPRDISDVTANTYTYLVNGHAPGDNLEFAFEPGERVRLRFINGSAMTFFNVRIPGVPMTVIAADGQDVNEVEVDEFQIGVAETYDVIVAPPAGSHAIVAESMDRSGMGVASLTSHRGHIAPPPPLREIPTLTMTDMGMMDHEAIGHDMGEGMEAMDHSMRDTSLLPADVKAGPGIDMVAQSPEDRMDFPGLGLDTVEHRVLRYTDLRAKRMNPHRRVEREMEIHLTGNMERYMWSFDGRKFTAATDQPIRFGYDERVRVKLVNQTMMAHPIHLHGHFFELVNGADHMHQPLKHTVIVQPGGTATFDLTADEPGDWAFHCHLLYHMHAGMMQVVTVRPFPESGKA
ncbi:copper-resistance protein, CopA family [Erythrobacter litoralis]|uniref:Copper-binding protein n=1 Tax=Erythrobacter litoralis TaxID=39960 RepID=A0A074MFM8_9SPHN|nr:copper resistance system multicopper oxidase [Erythrobacter litoralis]AOL22104.1 copper-resistance protein, CopA family [Erythrobacter litoralis]KEO90643.1 copper-binding protein [Erythrobacter litoralis]